MKTDNKKTSKGNSALRAAAVGRSAVGHVEAHSNSGLANTGTNISYEGATAPGAGGSVGTGYASGKEAAGETIRTTSEDVLGWDNKQVKNQAKAKNEQDQELNEELEDEDLDEDLGLHEDDEDVDYEEEEEDDEL